MSAYQVRGAAAMPARALRMMFLLDAGLIAMEMAPPSRKRIARIIRADLTISDVMIMALRSWLSRGAGDDHLLR